MKRPGSKRLPARLRGCESGHTLVEMMAALAIFAVFSTGIGISISTQYETAETTEEHNRALAGCQQVLQTVSTMLWDTMLVQSGATFTVAEVPGTGTIQISNDLNDDGDKSDPNEGTGDLYRITASVNNVALTTYRTKEGI